MNLVEFLHQVIEHGITGAKADYCKPEQADKLRGSLAGFEACRGKNPKELLELLQEASKDTQKAHLDWAGNYWEVRCREAEIEWVCNVVSAVLVMSKAGPPITMVTARGVMAANRILKADGCIMVRDETPYPDAEMAMRGVGTPG